MATITLIRESRRRPGRLEVQADGRPLGTVSRRAMDLLGLTVGMTVDACLLERLDGEAAFDAAERRAMKWINRKALSTAEVYDRLRDREVPPPLADRVCMHLNHIGALDDQALARALVEECLRRRPAGEALLRRKLESRQLPAVVVEQILGQVQAADGADSIQAAETLGRSRLPRWRNLPAATQARRLAGLLGRRGFDETTVQTVVQRLITDLDDASQP